MTLPVPTTSLPDTQSERDDRGIPISEAGISRYSLPLDLRDVDGAECSTIAEFDASVSLLASDRGAHMSRFVQFLNRLDGHLQLDLLGLYAERMANTLDAVRGQLNLAFPWYVRKAAPLTRVQGLLELQAAYQAMSAVNGASTVRQTVRVPATSLCPCSRAISKYGAHNQRCIVTVHVNCARPIAIQRLVDAVETNASCELYPALKRADEKVVTERAYENPKFAEDIVRDIAVYLNLIPDIKDFEITCESIESIHNHSAFAKASSTEIDAPLNGAGVDLKPHIRRNPTEKNS